MTNTAAARAQYLQAAIASATPERLVTMLFDRLLIDLGRAERAHAQSDWTAYSRELLHAQDIVDELASSLRVDVWDGAEGLLALYRWVGDLLVGANIQRDPERIREAADLLEPLRTAWHEAADAVAAPTTASGALARVG